MRRTATDIYRLARSAGLSVTDSVIAVAVGLAESSGDDAAIGDVNLQTTMWGPSVGIWQIRTLKSDTGKGTDRDINALKGNPARQAQAMVSISSSGRDWSPWTVYNTGAYNQYLGQAQSAATATGAVIQPVTLPASIPTPSSVVEGAKTILVQLLAGTLGVVLVGTGIVLAVSPTARGTFKTALKAAGL